MIIARFKIEKKDGLREAYIYADDVYLPTVNDEAAEYFADQDTAFNLMWRIAGPTDSSLEVTMQVGAGAAKTIVKSKIRATDNGMRADTNTIKLQG